MSATYKALSSELLGDPQRVRPPCSQGSPQLEGLMKHTSTPRARRTRVSDRRETQCRFGEEPAQVGAVAMGARRDSAEATDRGCVPQFPQPPDLSLLVTVQDNRMGTGFVWGAQGVSSRPEMEPHAFFLKAGFVLNTSLDILSEMAFLPNLCFPGKCP